MDSVVGGTICIYIHTNVLDAPLAQDEVQVGGREAAQPTPAAAAVTQGWVSMATMPHPVMRTPYPHSKPHCTHYPVTNDATTRMVAPLLAFVILEQDRVGVAGAGVQ